MKVVLVVLLMALPAMAQETGIGVPPPPTTQSIGDTIGWTHSLVDMNGQPLVPSGFVIMYANTEAELNTVAEKELGLVDLSLYQDTNNPNLFTYKASFNAGLNGKSLCLQMVAYKTVTVESVDSRLDSARSPVLCGTIMSRLEAPKTVTVQ